MEKQQARRIIRETFEASFDKSKFTLFIKNLLNNIDEERFVYKGNYIPDAYRQYIKLLERVGKFSDGENSIDILIVTLLKDTSLEHARTMQRNFIAWYLNGSHGGAMKDAALVAFVSPNETDWRFSLVRMDYIFERDKADNLKVREEFTSAQRLSFLVGANEKSHTAQSRLVEILANDEQAPTLLEIEEAFNIELVTKEFFLKYRELFLKTKEELDNIIKIYPKVKSDFETKDIDTVSFAKKLLGQIVFLYFLQKKGWFGVECDAGWGEGSKNFLNELFNEKYGKYNYFFNDILEPFFYEALRLEHPGDYYKRFNCRIPFLNGGLFDPINDYDWENTDIFLPNDVFSNENKTKEGDIGDGIFDIFDRYNFTVKEDEPLEKEVAIDPEMLGKVFENLLEVKDRKSKGTYYTPREIVHYMCQESLSNYLSAKLTRKVSKKDIDALIKYGESVFENDSHIIDKRRETRNCKLMFSQSVREYAKLLDENLASIRICDPAVGSGAFPVGMMNEIIRIRRVLTPYVGDNSKRTPYYFKRQAIQNCLYGVDIDPGAVEITKLRLWLSLIVDEEERETIQPLPNLDYKIMQGNSLLSEFMGIDFDKEDVSKNVQLSFAKDDVDNLVEKLKDRKNEYLNKAGVYEKQKLKHEIEDLMIEIFETKLKNKKTNYFSRIKEIDEKYKNLPNKNQRETLIQAEKEKLYKTLGFSLDQFERQLREYTTGNKTRSFFPWRLYFAEVFHEKKGFDVVIANPPYIDSEAMVKKGQKELRGIIAKNYQMTKGNWDIYIAFFERGFMILNAKGALTFITPDKWIAKPFGYEFRKTTISKICSILKAGRYVFNEAKVDSIITFFVNIGCQSLRVFSFEGNRIVFKNEIDKTIISEPFTLDFIFSSYLKLLNKIEMLPAKIRDLAECESACATSDAYKIKPFINNLCKGEFNSAKHLKVINTGTIGKYTAKWGKGEMTYLKDKYFNPVVDKKEFIKIFNNSYSRKSVRPKIIIKGLTLLDACLDEEGIIIPGKSTLIIADESIEKLKYLLAIINSTLAFFYINEKYPSSSYNQGINFTKNMINNFPIPKKIEKDKGILISLIDKILVITRNNDYYENSIKQAKVCEYKKQIDLLVYKNYELTPDEIEIVEGKNEDTN